MTLPLRSYVNQRNRRLKRVLNGGGVWLVWSLGVRVGVEGDRSLSCNKLKGWREIGYNSVGIG